MGYKSDAQRKAVHASKADGGKGAPSKMKKKSSMKMKKESAMKMKKESAMKMKKKSPAKKPLVGKQKNLPKHLQEGIIRKKKISEAEEDAMPSFESLRDETNASVPEAPQDPAESEPDISHMGETPEPGMFEPDLGITEEGGPEEPPADPLPRAEPMEVSFVAERLNNQEQELQIEAAEVQRKASADIARQELAAAKLQQEGQIKRQQIQSDEDIAALKAETSIANRR